MATRLANVVRFVNVPLAVPTSLPHGLNIDDTLALIPDEVFAGGTAAGAFTVTADNTNITVTNNGLVPADVDVLAKSWHTILREFGAAQNVALVPQPFVVSSGGAPAAGNTLGQAYDEGGPGAGALITEVPGVPVGMRVDAIAQTLVEGLRLDNTTPATLLVAQQFSPAIAWSGNFWEGLGGPSRQVDYAMYARAVFGGGTPPATQLSIAYNFNGGGYADYWSFLSDASMVFEQATAANAPHLHARASLTSGIRFNGTSTETIAAGAISFTVSSANVVTRKPFLPDTTSSRDIGSSSVGFRRLYINYNGISTNQTQAVFIENETLAALGAQQYSPVVSLAGQGWETAVGSSMDVRFGMQTRPVQGVAAPTGDLVWMQSVNGAAYGDLLALNSTGRLRNSDGTAALPAYSFLSSTDMGMAKVSGDLALCHTGGVRIAVRNADIQCYRDLNPNGAWDLGSSAALWVDEWLSGRFYLNNAGDTYITSLGAQQINFIASAEYFRVTSSYVEAGRTFRPFSDATFYCGTDGRAWRRIYVAYNVNAGTELGLRVQPQSDATAVNQQRNSPVIELHSKVWNAANVDDWFGIQAVAVPAIGSSQCHFLYDPNQADPPVYNDAGHYDMNAAWHFVGAVTVGADYAERYSPDATITHANGSFAADGDAQTGQYVLRINSTGAGGNVMTLDGAAAAAGNTLVVPQDAAILYEIYVSGKQSGSANAGGYTFSVLVSRNGAAAPAIVGAVTKVVVAESVAAWDANVAIGAANDLRITVTGVAATNIRWVAFVRTTEVIYS